jgi:hypothetical protein
MHNRSAVVLGTYSMIGCSMTLGENLAPLWKDWLSVRRLPVAGNKTARIAVDLQD